MGKDSFYFVTQPFFILFTLRVCDGTPIFYHVLTFLALLLLGKRQGILPTLGTELIMSISCEENG